MPDESALDSLDMNDIKVEKLVREFLAAQSLKILPQQPFGDAVTQFVEKNDKHALESFVGDALSDQVREMLNLDAGADDEDLDEAMEAKKQAMEKAFAAGIMKLRKKQIKYKPKPRNWDSDLDGEWEDQPQAIADDDDDDDEEEAASVGVKAPAKKVPLKRAPTKKAPAKTTKAPAKKAPARKTPAGKAPVRGRKKAAVSEEEEEEDVQEDEDEDVIMLDDDDEGEPVPAPATKKAPPKRAAPARGAAARTNLRQQPLNFSQHFSQPSQAAKKSTQKNLISDDEISDDDDAFAPAVSQQPSRRR